MHYLITGGAGFIGSHLAARLVRTGHTVTILDNMSTGKPENLANVKARLVNGDVLDTELVFHLARNCDCIIHLAAVVGVRLAMNKGIDSLKVSFHGTENVLEAALAFDKPVFIASSSAIYGKAVKIPVSEDDDYLLGSSTKASWLYSVGKLAEEHISLAYWREKQAKVKIGRFFNVIGPNQTGRYGMVVPRFVTAALKNEPLPVYGDGSQTRTFAYIEDAIDGLLTVLEHGQYGLVYNIGGTQEVTIRHLAETVIALTGSSSPIQYIPYEDAFGPDFEETARRAPDISRLKKLGYSPRFTLEEALKKIIDHHRSLFQKEKTLFGSVTNTRALF